ncbi:MAG: hypothetical protein ACLQQ4_07295 [Bacteroidia bacterium]
MKTKHVLSKSTFIRSCQCLKSLYLNKHYKELRDTPAMNGSYSIKAVLPALVPDLNYDNMVIADGNSASNAFEGLLNGADSMKITTVRNQLLEYCKMDTLGMVKILEVLETLL